MYTFTLVIPLLSCKTFCIFYFVMFDTWQCQEFLNTYNCRFQFKTSKHVKRSPCAQIRHALLTPFTRCTHSWKICISFFCPFVAKSLRYQWTLHISLAFHSQIWKRKTKIKICISVHYVPELFLIWSLRIKIEVSNWKKF